jgi:hypothetical protein
MPDITLCKDGGCPLKYSCRRYTAKPSQRQSWFSESPRKGRTCKLFLGNLLTELEKIVKGKRK